MHPKRLRRLPDFNYHGPQRYSLTICTYHRQSIFHDGPLATCVIAHFLAAADACKYEVIVYCLMPDHMHVLAVGGEGCDDLDEFVKKAKQMSGYHGKRLIQRPVWQPGYYERVLRDWEDTRVVAAYILDNPVRKGLVKAPQDYPLSGSGVYTMQEVIDFIQIRPT
jgi:putative transposase